VSETSLISRRLALLVLAAACGGRGEKEASGELAELSFRADQPGLLLTWIDGGGQTHLEESVAAIPEAHRELVRIVFEGEARGTGDPIYVADVRAPGADGGFRARSMARRDWEAEIERRRRDSPEAARTESRPRERPTAKPDVAPEAASAAPTASASAGPKEPPPFGALSAVVFGADWCGPCKKAKAHLAKRGVVVDYRDIDRDPSSRREMLRLLGPRGRSDAPIPVIELGGRVLVGFSAGAIDDAIAAARRGSTVL
jgi:glutaredoxin